MSVSLGTASAFAVLAGSGITNTGTTTITGDVGTFPTTTETGFGSVTITGTNHVGDSTTQTAKTDLTTAYVTAAGLTPTGDLSGLVLGSGGTVPLLTPGIYSFSSSAQLTGTLTLDGVGNYVFQIATTLTTASSSAILLINGANSNNIFWQVGSSATLGTSTNFAGSILALTSITLTTSASVRGRTLARNGAVTLDTNVINNTAVCFVKGTGILTPRGYTLIENLNVGDVVTIHGYIAENYKYVDNSDNVAAKVIWISSYKLNNMVNQVKPICIRKNALGVNMPNKDVYVSPGHGLYIDGSFISAKFLVNGTTIFQDTSFDDVTYYHVELEHHSVLNADGLYAESFLDENFSRNSFPKCSKIDSGVVECCQ